MHRVGTAFATDNPRLLKQIFLRQLFNSPGALLTGANNERKSLKSNQDKKP